MDCVTKQTLHRGKRTLPVGSHVVLDQPEYLRLRAYGVVESAEEARLRAEYAGHMAEIEAEAQAAALEVRKKLNAEAPAPEVTIEAGAPEASDKAPAAAAPKGSRRSASKAAKQGPALDVIPAGSGGEND